MSHSLSGPRVYAYGLVWRSVGLLGSALFLGLGLFALLGGMAGSIGNLPGWSVSLAGAGFIAFAAYWAVSAFRYATIIDGDLIIRRDVFRERSMRRQDIAGLRAGTSQYIPSLRLESAQTGGKSLTIYVLQPDAAFHQWFEGIPDLDERDRKAAEREALADEQLGATPEERAKRLAAAKALMKWPNLAGLGIMVWIFAAPRPYELAIGVGVLCPLLAVVIAATSGGAIGLTPGARADSSGLIAPGLALFLRALLDVGVVDWVPAMAAGLGVGAIGALVIGKVDRGAPGKVWALLLVYGLGAATYGWGAIVEGNYLLDRNSPRAFPVKVLDRHVSDGKTTLYDLSLPAWGPREADTDTSVSRSFYDSVKVGDTVCAYLSPGALRIRWYEIGHCADAGAPQS